MGMFKCAELKR